MADDYGGWGWGGRQHGVHIEERAGGRSSDLAQPLVHTLLRVAGRLIECAYLIVLAPLLIGPAILPVYALLAARPAIAWTMNVIGARVEYRDERGEVKRDAAKRPLYRDAEPEDVSRAWAVLAFFAALWALLALPELPWLAPVSRATAWGLWVRPGWLARWPQAQTVAAVWRVLLRVLLTVGLWYGWREEVWYWFDRSRRETIAPTTSSIAPNPVDAHLIDIPGIEVLARDPIPPPDPEPAERTPTRRDIPLDQERAVTAYGAGVLVGNGNGHGEDGEDEEDGASLALPGPVQVELIAFPVGLFRGRGKQAALNAQTFARRVLDDEAHYSQNWAVEADLITDWKARRFFAWMQDNGHADPPDAQNQRALTGRGRRLLRKVARGEIEPV